MPDPRCRGPAAWTTCSDIDLPNNPLLGRGDRPAHQAGFGNTRMLFGYGVAGLAAVRTTAISETAQKATLESDGPSMAYLSVESRSRVDS